MRQLTFNVLAAALCVTVCSYGELTVADELTQHGSVNLDNIKTEHLLSSLTPVKRSTTDSVTMEYIDSICGQENVIDDIKQQNATALSRFPWIVAVLKKDNDKLGFQCGGNLISTKTVLSNGHCYYYNPAEYVVSLNWYKESKWSDAFNIDVKKVIISPELAFNADGDADLAILLLKQSVTFTDSLRPICMWQGSEDVEGMSGTVISFGGHRKLKPKHVPILLNATIVSTATCLKSNNAYINLISNRTLCADNEDGIGPCIGDSGNGLMIQKGNKWMLRGLLSSALIEDLCTSYYVVYTDAAKHIEWIRSNMLL